MLSKVKLALKKANLLSIVLVLMTSGLTTSIVAGFVTNYTFPFLPHFSAEQEEITFKSIKTQYAKSDIDRIREAIDFYDAKNYDLSLIHLKSIELSIHKSKKQISQEQEAFIYLVMGVCHYELQQLPEAEKFLEKSLSLFPSSYPHRILSDIFFNKYNKSGLKADLKKHKKHSDKAYYLKTSLFKGKSEMYALKINDHYNIDLENKFYIPYHEGIKTDNAIESLSNKKIELARTENIDNYFNLSLSSELGVRFNDNASKNGILNKTFVKGINIGKGKVHLISVGINNYSDKKIRPLRYAEKDSKDIIKSFYKMYGKNLIHYNVLGKDASKGKILSTILSVRGKVLPNDRIIFYYSGHGYAINNLDLNKENYIIPKDGSINNLEDTAISLKYISKLIKVNNSMNFIIIDACNENIYKSKETIKYSTLNNIESNTTVIYSSSSGQLSAESSKFKNGVFTHFFNEKTRVIASLDKNNDGNISIKEFISPIEIDMNNYLSKINMKQKISVIPY